MFEVGLVFGIIRVAGWNVADEQLLEERSQDLVPVFFVISTLDNSLGYYNMAVSTNLQHLHGDVPAQDRLLLQKRQSEEQLDKAHVNLLFRKFRT